MGLITASIPNLINGISQQSFSQRLASQAEAQVNMMSTVVDGLKKRPPSRHRAKLTGDDWSDAYLHTINRDAAERYAVAISGGDLKVFDLDGAEQTVAFPDGKGYLSASSPSTAFRAVSVADYTFIVNTETTVAMTSDVTATRPAEALINVRQGNYGRTYRIEIDGAERASYQTPDGAEASDAEDIDTIHIATQLYDDLVAASLSGFTITRIQNAIHIVKDSGDFSIAVEDGFNGAAMKLAKGKLQTFSDLPNEGPDGFQVEIVGEAASRFDNYYVRFEKLDADDSAGVWRETIAMGVPYALDAAAMPHVLVRESDGSFTFKQADWEEREVGDAESAPEPSFVGRTINDVFFFRNRLGFLADESVVFSRAGDFFDFWPKTVTALVDSDPVDLAASTNRVSILRHATPFGRSLLVFADQTQFVLQAGDLLTPTGARLLPTTEFVASLEAKPAAAGRNVYFTVAKGAYAGLREYQVENAAQADDAADVTRHVPRFIPGGVFKLAAAANEDLLVALTRGAAHKLFVYKFYWSGDEKLQSSWSEWELASGDQILNADFIDTKLVLVVARADGAYLEEIDTDPGATDAGQDWLALIDRKLDESQVSAAYALEDGVGYTTLTLPYAEDGDLWVAVRAGDPALVEGQALPYTRPSSTEVKLQGDHRSSKLLIGRRYGCRYRFSPFVARAPASGGGLTAEQGGRLQILYLTLHYARSGGFDVVVTPTARSAYRYSFTGRVLGAGANVLGALGFESGDFRLPIYAENDGVVIEIQSDGFLPCAFTSAEWEGARKERGRRVR